MGKKGERNTNGDQRKSHERLRESWEEVIFELICHTKKHYFLRQYFSSRMRG
jgi:hypothetical protein